MALARFPISDDASLAVRGGRFQRHWISLSTDVWSKTVLFTRGKIGDPMLKGDAITVGTRRPSRARPSTRSASAEFGAITLGGGTWSKKPPHSSKVTIRTDFGQQGPFTSA